MLLTTHWIDFTAPSSVEAECEDPCARGAEGPPRFSGPLSHPWGSSLPPHTMPCSLLCSVQQGVALKLRWARLSKAKWIYIRCRLDCWILKVFFSLGLFELLFFFSKCLVPMGKLQAFVSYLGVRDGCLIFLMPKVGNFFIGSKLKMYTTVYSYILSSYEIIYCNNCNGPSVTDRISLDKSESAFFM